MRAAAAFIASVLLSAVLLPAVLLSATPPSNPLPGPAGVSYGTIGTYFCALTGCTMTGQTVYSGVTTDITTGTNEDLTLVANGTGAVDLQGGGGVKNSGSATPTGGQAGDLYLNDGVTVGGHLTQIGALSTGANAPATAAYQFDGRKAGAYDFSILGYGSGSGVIGVQYVQSADDSSLTNARFAYIASWGTGNAGLTAYGVTKAKAAELLAGGDTSSLNIGTSAAAAVNFIANNIITAAMTTAGMFKVAAFGSFANCAVAGATPACAAAPAGASSIVDGATAVTISTTAVTANSEIPVWMDMSLGSRLGVTCNTTFEGCWISARTAGTSFTVTCQADPAGANPMCIGWGPITN